MVENKRVTRLTFSKTRLLAIEPPAAGRIYWHDEKTPGLTLCVTEKGAKIFYLYRKVSGRPVRVRIGPFPGLTVENARKLAAGLNVAIAAGHDPQETKRERRQEPTFADLFGEWMERHAKPRQKRWDESQRIYDTLLKPLHPRRLSSIKRPDIQRLHSKIGADNGHYAANRALDVLKSAFSQAEDLLGWKGENPCRRVRQFEKRARDRFLRGDELPRFFQAVNAEDPVFRDFFTLCLLTGARRGNVQAMRWEEIDWGNRFWRIPETKNGQPVIVPLVAPAVKLLRDRQAEAGGNPWVFPSRGKSGHLVEVKSAWARILNRSGLTDLRPHDLRRSLGSWMAIQGSSLPIVGKALGHMSQAATAVYARLSFDPVRDAVDAATGAMLAAAKPQNKEGG